MEIAENAQFRKENNTITLEITNNVFDILCCNIDSNSKTHEQVGCFLSSSIACILAKVTGKSAIIQNETHKQQTKITKIIYHIADNNRIKV